MKFLHFIRIAIFMFYLSSLFAVTSCSIGGKSSPSHFYMLGPQIENTNIQNMDDISMGVGPIIIPGYIDRPQIVTKTETAELHLSEFDRWAAIGESHAGRLVGKRGMWAYRGDHRPGPR